VLVFMQKTSNGSRKIIKETTLEILIPKKRKMDKKPMVLRSRRGLASSHRIMKALTSMGYFNYDRLECMYWCGAVYCSHAENNTVVGKRDKSVRDYALVA